DEHRGLGRVTAARRGRARRGRGGGPRRGGPGLRARRADARRRRGGSCRRGPPDRGVRSVPRARTEAGTLVAVTATRALTGGDLTTADVWAVAVEREPTPELSDTARHAMSAARALVERAAHGSSEHTYGVNTGFGRFVSKQIPEELTEELQLRLLRS